MRTLFTSLAFSLTLSASAFSCGETTGWETPTAGSALSLAKAQEQVNALGVSVSKSNMQSKCGSDYEYDVKLLKNDQYLASIPVPASDERADNGATLLARTKQLLKTPLEQLISLTEARQRFYDDTRGTEQELGISAYDPNALPLAERVRNNGREFLFYVTLEEACFKEGGMHSPHQISYEFWLPKAFEYIPGRSDYSADSIYQTGDFLKAVVADSKVMEAARSQVADNVKFCRRQTGEYTRPWAEVAYRLNSENAQQLSMNALERFHALKKATPVAAYMKSSNTIVVRFSSNQGSGDLSFSDAKSVILEIQAELEKAHVKIDKRSRLNGIGKMEIEFSKSEKRKIPKTLQE